MQLLTPGPGGLFKHGLIFPLPRSPLSNHVPVFGHPCVRMAAALITPLQSGRVAEIVP